MSYSITPILHNYKDKQQRQKILIQVIFQRHKAYAPTPYKVTADQFDDGKVTGIKEKARINAAITKQCAELHTRLLKIMDQRNVGPDQLKLLVQGKSEQILFADFAEDYIKTASIKESTKEMYRSVVHVVLHYAPRVTLQDMDEDWLQHFETDQRKLKGINTVNKVLKKTKTLLYAAAEKKLIEESQFSRYKPPRYIQPIPEFLTEDEIAIFKQECDTIANQTKKLAGYYFLLSCYAGYRLDDAMNFNYKARVISQTNKIVVSTKKKDKLVSMPIHTRLREILDYIKDRPITISPYHLREYVYDIATIAGIQRKITYHTSRHTFAMLLMENGFSIEEVAELLGNDLESARIYARISNKRLERKVLSRLK